MSDQHCRDDKGNIGFHMLLERNLFDTRRIPSPTNRTPKRGGPMARSCWRRLGRGEAVGDEARCGLPKFTWHEFCWPKLHIAGQVIISALRM